MKDNAMEKDRVKLGNILYACEVIESVVDKYGLYTLTADEFLFSGLVKQTGIIGESVYKLSAEFKTEHPEIPWKQIETMRHILVHDYYGIDVDILLSVVEEDIPELKPKVQALYETEF